MSGSEIMRINESIRRSNEVGSNIGEHFECCQECDLPDACADFGCAIKSGVKESRLI